MRYLLITFIFQLLLTSQVWSNTVYYDPVTKKEVVDVSDRKGLEQIKAEFGLSDQTQVVVLAPNESTRVENNKLKKYDYVKENKQIAKEKKDKQKVKENKIRQKLGLSQAEWKDLLEALGITRED